VVNGILIVPTGETLEYVHYGFESVFAQELQHQDQDGVEIGRRQAGQRASKKPGNF